MHPLLKLEATKKAGQLLGVFVLIVVCKTYYCTVYITVVSFRRDQVFMSFLP